MERTYWLALSFVLAGFGSGCSADPKGNGDADTDSDTGSYTGPDADSDTDSGTPTAPEVCDDTLDNDGDGVADCQDDDCLGQAACGPCDARYDEMEAAQPILFNEIFFNVADDQVELKNYGTQSQSLTGWILATALADPSIEGDRNRVYQFAAGITIPPGDFVTIHFAPIDGCDLDNEACGVGGFLNDLTASSGDIAIYRANDPDCPDALVDYVKWDDPANPADEDAVHDLYPIAQDAGEWPPPLAGVVDAVDMTGWARGTSALHDGSQQNGKTHWYLDTTPTIGKDNDYCRLDSDCWGGQICTDRVCGG